MNKVGQIIERQTPMWPRPEYGSNRSYHPYTRGWILNEVFRRVEPQGRTLGEYVRDEISNPLGGGINIGEPLTKVQDLSVLHETLTVNGQVLPGSRNTQVQVLFKNTFIGKYFFQTFTMFLFYL